MINSVLSMMRGAKPEADGRNVFAQLMFTSAAAQSLDGVASDKLARFASECFAHLARKPHKRHAIGIRSTDTFAGAPGLPATASVVEILNDDMPYVVESVMGEIHARGLKPLLVVHPIFKVTRFGSGNLTAVTGGGDTNWSGGNQESFIAVVFDLLDDVAAKELIAALELVLEDVRHAANDIGAMGARLGQAITAYETMQLALNAAPGSPAPLEVREAVEFLRWLGKGHFTMLGFREYEFVGSDQAPDLWPMASGALGVFRTPEFTALRRGSEQLQITPEIRAFYNSPSPLIITKANAVSRVRRRTHLDYIGIKRYSVTGKLLGELRLVGLFTPAAYLQPVDAVPLLRRKVQGVLAAAKFPPDSHNGRTLIDILEAFPRDELFQISAERLQAWAMALLDLQLRPRVRVLARRDEFSRYYSILVFTPREQYSSAMRERIGGYLAHVLGGRVTAFYPFITSSPLVRTQFIIGLGDNPPNDIPDELLEHDIAELLRTWGERLEAAILGRLPAGRAPAVVAAFGSAFSAGYTETFPVERAIEDIARIERLGPERPVAVDFYREADGPSHRVRATVYRHDTPIPLSERVPLLENFGFRVIDERSYHVRPTLDGAARNIVLHDMVLESADGASIDLTSHEARMEEAFLAVFHGHAENDLFNTLIMAAGLDWHQTAVMRAYAAYLRQIRAPFGHRAIAETLARNHDISRALFELLRICHFVQAEASAELREASSVRRRQALESSLAAVESLEDDRILRRMLNLVLATVRTNAFERTESGHVPATIAFKLDSRTVDQMPEPRPFREIFVYSPRVEGIHLRFSAIARGGIRWSDRPQDFRTEVLGLAKAQQVKNTVIVPSGAKGGFVPKQMKRNATREETAAEGVACYRLFITGLLSLTDNVRDGTIVPPPGLVRLDGDDPYLVVAADKGTASFSDDANAISLASGFWLGDAFASGGSAGYDHKRMGITARGAWECVRRHFREIDIDIQVQPFRAIGVGDMSGDVFGNAMLLSPATLLVAAFDHRDIFIDPAPDPAVSLAERQRLFALPRSSWSDYDKAKISPGGGVFPRTAKSVPLTPQMQALLGVAVAALPPSEVIQAILRAEIDLLWFGGIGTYIRDSSETDEQVGDRANDALRIVASDVRARVIGEGANLGVTQRGRIEAARAGVRIDTDFIDNSAGVNTSDQEVNIKIALEPVLASGQLAREDRNRLLAAMTAEVTSAVLLNNYQQGLALSLAERTSARDIAHLGRLARSLEERGLIVRKLEALPSGAEFIARASAGDGMTRPELAVLLSWSKIALNMELLAGPLPNDPAFEPLLLEYFPTALREGYRSEILSHRLRREIIATRLTNSIINRGGPAAMVRLAAETGRGTADIANAFIAARTILGLPELWSEIDHLDGRIGGQLQLELYQSVQDLLIAQTSWLLDRQGGRSFAELIEAYQPAGAVLWKGFAGLVGPARRRELDVQSARLMQTGVPADLAVRLSGLDVIAQTTVYADRARLSRGTVENSARLSLLTAEFLRTDDFRARVLVMKAADEYDRQAIAAGLAALEDANAAVVERMLASPPGTIADVTGWIASRAPAVASAKSALDTILSQPDMTVARLTVAANHVRGFI